MRALLKIGFSLLVLAFLLIGVSYSMLRAHGTNGTSSPNFRFSSTSAVRLRIALTKSPRWRYFT